LEIVKKAKDNDRSLKIKYNIEMYDFYKLLQERTYTNKYKTTMH